MPRQGGKTKRSKKSKMARRRYMRRRAAAKTKTPRKRSSQPTQTETWPERREDGF